MPLLRRAVIVFLVLVPAGVSAGCGGDCVASCARFQTRFEVDPAITAITVCDSTGGCTETTFETAVDPVISRSVTLLTPDDGGEAVLEVEAFDRNGRPSVSETITAPYGDGECGCALPAVVYIADGSVAAFDEDAVLEPSP
jgi:hypothetical protein